jgi:hypothetical protein
VWLVNHGNFQRLVLAAFWVESEFLASEQPGQLGDPRSAARRAAIDRCLVAGNRVGIGLASRVAALGALRLRKQVVDTFSQGGHGAGEQLGRSSEYVASV